MAKFELPKKGIVIVRSVNQDKNGFFSSIADANRIIQPFTTMALYSSDKGGLDTNLTEEEEIFFKEKYGYDTSSVFNPEEPHPFWGSKQMSIKLEYGDNVFDLSKPIDYLKVKILKSESCYEVANTLRDAKVEPRAIFAIYDEQVDAEMKSQEVSGKMKAYQTLAKLTAPKKKTLLTVMLNEVVNNSDEWITGKLGELLEKDYKRFNEVSSETAKDLEIKSLLIVGSYKGYITKEGSAYYYLGDKFANDIEEALDYFKDENNQSIKIKLMEKINN